LTDYWININRDLLLIRAPMAIGVGSSPVSDCNGRGSIAVSMLVFFVFRKT